MKYQITREISAESPVSFYEAVGFEDKKTVWMRIFEGRDASDPAIDAWYDLYGQFQERVSNYKHLPRVKEIQSLSRTQVYVVLEHEPGATLRERRRLSLSQGEQLLDAVAHLHAKGLVHGGITPDQIWLTDKGNVILHGALEWQARKDRPQRSQTSDVQQVADLFVHYLDIGANQMDVLEQSTFSSVEQLQHFLQTPSIPSAKPGLVEKEQPKQSDKSPVERNQQTVRMERPVQQEQTVRMERPVQQERTVRMERSVQQEQTVRMERSVQQEQTYRTERPLQQEQPYRTERPFQQERPYRTDQPNRQQQQPDRTERPLPKKRGMQKVMAIAAAVVAGIVIVGGLAFTLGQHSMSAQSKAASTQSAQSNADGSTTTSSAGASGSSSAASQTSVGSDTSNQQNANMNNGQNGNANSNANSSGNNAPNGTPSADSGSTGALVPFQMGDLTVSVPSGWNKAPIGGQGDWSGYQFTNPNDANQSITVIRSSCVGCAMNQQQFAQGVMKPDPTALVPRNNTGSFVFNNGLSDGYSFNSPDDPYPGNGVVTVTQNSGYGQVTVFLPAAQKPLASQILNSFALSD